DALASGLRLAQREVREEDAVPPHREPEHGGTEDDAVLALARLHDAADLAPVVVDVLDDPRCVIPVLAEQVQRGSEQVSESGLTPSQMPARGEQLARRRQMHGVE